MTLEFLEPVFRLCVVTLDYDVLKMPESPGEVLEALALLQRLATFEQTRVNVCVLQYKSCHSGADVKEVDMPTIALCASHNIRCTRRLSRARSQDFSTAK